MADTKYDVEQITEQVKILLEAGCARQFKVIAEQLAMPETSLRRILDGKLPEVESVEVEAPIVSQIVALLRDSPRTRTEIADELDIGPSRVESLIESMVASGHYDIQIVEKKVVLPDVPSPPPRLDYIWPGGGRVTFGHCSDLHYGSIFHQSTALHHFAHEAVETGTKYMIVSGDITAGTKMYKGQEQDLYAMGADEQVDAALNGIPRIAGLTWLLQGGNHDESFFKEAGTNVVKRICEDRSDCVYVGFTKCDVPVCAGKHIRLYHPSGGMPYAKSYRGQKLAEDTTKDWMTDAFSENEVSSIIALQWGHTHYKDWFVHGPMQVFNPGCFEGQNSYGARKALHPEIGGVTSTYDISEEGWVRKSNLTWYHYRPAENDYRPVMRQQVFSRDVQIEPLYSWADLEGGN